MYVTSIISRDILYALLPAAMVAKRIILAVMQGDFRLVSCLLSSFPKLKVKTSYDLLLYSISHESIAPRSFKVDFSGSVRPEIPVISVFS